LSQKRHFFADFLGEKIKKIITSVPSLSKDAKKCKQVHSPTYAGTKYEDLKCKRNYFRAKTLFSLKMCQQFYLYFRAAPTPNFNGASIINEFMFSTTKLQFPFTAESFTYIEALLCSWVLDEAVIQDFTYN
jgi:hypothetical protein